MQKSSIKFGCLQGNDYFCRKNSDDMAKEISKNSAYVRFDWAIKRILRDSANKKVLEGLISVLVKKPVTIIEIIESGSNKIRKEDKSNCVDVKAKMEDGEIVIVEVQLSREVDFFQRILFGTATAINDQIEMGQDYEVIKKIYSINILYFDFGKGDDYAYHGYMDFHGMTKPGSVLTFPTESEQKYIRENAKRFIPPEEVLPEIFLLIVNKFNEVARTPIEEWMAYLKDGIISDDTQDPGLQEARRKLDFMKMTREEQRAYRDYMVSVYSTQDAFETARSEGYAEGMEQGMEQGMKQGMEQGMKQGMEQGMEQGMKQGMKQGMEQGMKQGMKQGMEQGEKKRETEIARGMKSDGLPVATISKYTGLSAEEIAAL